MILMRLRLKPTRKTIAWLSAASALSLALAGLTIRQQGALRAQWQAKLDAKRKEADAIESAAKQLPDSQQQLAQIQERISILRNIKPNAFQPALLEEMSAMAHHSGLRLMVFNPIEGRDRRSPIAKLDKKVAPHKFLTFAVGVQGNFRSVSQFVYRLTGLSKMVSVDGLQIQPLGKGGENDVRAVMQITAYIVKEIHPKTVAAVNLLQDAAIAEEKYKGKHQEYGKLAALNSEGLLALKEGETREGYTFITDASTGKGTFKILATAKETDLHNLSIDQTKKVMDETDKESYE